MEGKNIRQKLLEIQRDLKCDKSQYNSFGDFMFRSKEDILEAAKPLAHERGCTIIVDDSIVIIENNWVYMCATATLTDVETGDSVKASGYSREPESKKGADPSQITGMAASYAGKRALGNLFALDDTKDSDTPAKAGQPAPPQGPFNGRCRSCGATAMFQDSAQFEAYRTALQCCPSPNYEVV